MPRFAPIPDPSGSLDPPRRFPPTALATATPEPEPQRSHTATRATNRISALQVAVRVVEEVVRSVAGTVHRALARLH
jgi:hypothetical protein